MPGMSPPNIGAVTLTSGATLPDPRPLGGPGHERVVSRLPYGAETEADLSSIALVDGREPDYGALALWWWEGRVRQFPGFNPDLGVTEEPMLLDAATRAIRALGVGSGRLAVCGAPGDLRVELQFGRRDLRVAVPGLYHTAERACALAIRLALAAQVREAEAELVAARAALAALTPAGQ